VAVESSELGGARVSYSKADVLLVNEHTSLKTLYRSRLSTDPVPATVFVLKLMAERRRGAKSRDGMSDRKERYRCKAI